MNENINQPYAKFFEFVMGILPEARKLLKFFGDKKLVKTLDLETLETAHGTFKSGQTGLENFITDMLFTCKCNGQDTYIHLLLEHKSYLENPKQQILLYLLLAYHQQKLDWKREREEAKQRGETVSKERFKLTPIIPILFYHGTRKWKDYKFADQFDLPEKWMEEFIPDVKIFVIDMFDFTDDYIEKIGSSFLQPMLFMFKHREDKEFLKQNTKKIFKFVEELTDDKFTQKYLKTIFYFMIQTFKLETGDVKDIIHLLPVKNINNMNMVQETVMTALDEAMYNGILQGREQGVEIGKKITELKERIEMILVFLKSFTDLKNIEIAVFCKVEEEFVTKTQKAFEQEEEVVLKQFVRDTFKSIADITEKNLLDMEEMMLASRKEFKKS